MANSWLRLWHDMPNDPKWRTIARVSGQPIALVQALYIHLLVTASQNVTRGHVDVTTEDLASALDVTEDEIGAVLEAMQGRVLEGAKLTGWESRQPKREDLGNDKTGAKSAAERKREQRAREKAAAEEVEKEEESRPDTTGHDASRNVTTDKDKDKDKSNTPPIPPQGGELIEREFEMLWKHYPKREGSNPRLAALKAYRARRKSGTSYEEIRDGLKRYIAFIDAKKHRNTEYVLRASTFFGTNEHFSESWSFTEASHATSGHGQPGAGGKQQRQSTVERASAAATAAEQQLLRELGEEQGAPAGGYAPMEAVG